MVRPTNFCTNLETLTDNKFMKKSEETNESINSKAQKEFDSFTNNLKSLKVNIMIENQPFPEASDAIFPNNWFSTHKNSNIPNGLLMIYPMKSESRRIERNEKIISELRKNYENFVDLSHMEKDQNFLESTGSLVIDNLNKRVFCSLSERANLNALELFIESLNKYASRKYELITFKSYDANNTIIYHTNVMMSVLEKHVVICSEVIKDLKEREKVLNLIKENREVIDITYNELLNFGCNILMVKNEENENILILSKTAYDNFSEKNRKILEDNYKLCVNAIDTIEFIGGGSARCMVGEIY